MVVASDERSAAGGITNIVRSLGMSAAPLLLGYLSAAQPRDGWVFSSPWFIAGGVSLGVSMLAWVQVLRKLPLTIAHPITGAIFVMVPLASHVLWNEPLPMRRVLGIAIIGAGIVVVARS
jgi:drug/metabolite transporter (DMT)-like permease